MHLTNASTWLRQILVPPVEIWVRGDFAANLLPEPSRLDLVVIWDGGVRSPQALWPLALLAASPISLHPGEMHLTLLRRSDVDFADDFAREAKRSGRRCRDRDGTSVETGWLEFGEEEP